MSAISTDEVARVAALARVALSDEEVSRLAGELDAVASSFARVTSVVTPDLPATSHPVPLTNVLRYAPTTPAVSVDVERHIGTVVLTVDNEAAPGTRPMHGSGKGLIGMRERASVYGGTVQAGPTPTGWRVRAVLRWDEHDEGTFSWQTPL